MEEGILLSQQGERKSETKSEWGQQSDRDRGQEVAQWEKRKVEVQQVSTQP